MVVVTYLLARWIQKNLSGKKYCLITKKALKFVEENGVDTKELEEKYKEYLI